MTTDNNQQPQSIRVVLLIEGSPEEIEKLNDHFQKKVEDDKLDGYFTLYKDGEETGNFSAHQHPEAWLSAIIEASMPGYDALMWRGEDAPRHPTKQA